jgi:hypothetical protein
MDIIQTPASRLFNHPHLLGQGKIHGQRAALTMKAEESSKPQSFVTWVSSAKEVIG